MSIITMLSLRSPENAARAMEAGAGDLAVQAMQKFPNAQQLQRNSCFMIRNLVARNPENRLVNYARDHLLVTLPLDFQYFTLFKEEIN